MIETVAFFDFSSTERTEKVPMGSIKNVVSEPIEGHEDYHMMVTILPASCVPPLFVLSEKEINCSNITADVYLRVVPWGSGKIVPFICRE